MRPKIEFCFICLDKKLLVDQQSMRMIVFLHDMKMSPVDVMNCVCFASHKIHVNGTSLIAVSYTSFCVIRSGDDVGCI
jgi:hypothetical protein